MLCIKLGIIDCASVPEEDFNTRQGAEPHAKDVHSPGAVVMSLVEEGQGYTGGH